MHGQDSADALLERPPGGGKDQQQQIPYNTFVSPQPPMNSHHHAHQHHALPRSTSILGNASGEGVLTVVIPSNSHSSTVEVGIGERSVRGIGHLLGETEEEMNEFIHQERRCCGCNCACGRCLSHCWFLTACCGFILLSSLPRFLSMIDFVVTVLIYSLSFAGRTQPSLTFWEFLQEDFTHYKFQTSGASLVILSFIRMSILFFTFAYRFHRRPFAFVTASVVAGFSALWILVTFAVNENEHLLSLLIWSLGITGVEYTVWLALRRSRIKHPALALQIDHSIASADMIVEDSTDTNNLLSPVRDTMDHSPTAPRDVMPASSSFGGGRKSQAYQRLGAEDDLETGGGGATGGMTGSLASTPPYTFSGPTAIPRISSSSSFGSLGGSYIPASSGSLSKNLFTRGSTEPELEPQQIADEDSLFVEIDSLIVHYKLSVNGRPVISGSNSRESTPSSATATATAPITSSLSSLSSHSRPDDSLFGSFSGGGGSGSVGSGRPASFTTIGTPLTTTQEYFDSAASATRAAFEGLQQGEKSTSPNGDGPAASTSVPPFAPFSSPLILLHGFGSSLFSFRAMWRELSLHSPIVLAFDRPGCGLTSRPIRDAQGSFGTYFDSTSASIRTGRGQLKEQENPYTQEYAVKLLLKLLTKLGLDDSSSSSRRSILVGHSTGGAVAVRASIMRPDLFQGCFLLAPHLFTAGFPAMLKSLLKTKLGKMITQQLVRSELGEVALKRSWFDSAHIPPDALPNHQRFLRIKGSMEALIEIAASVPVEGDPWAKLSTRLYQLAPSRPNPSNGGATTTTDQDTAAQAGIPICIIHGIQDKLLDLSESIKAHKQMRAEGVNCALIKMDHCGHVPHEEYPHLTLDHLVCFMREVEDATQLTQEDEVHHA